MRSSNEELAFFLSHDTIPLYIQIRVLMITIETSVNFLLLASCEMLLPSTPSPSAWFSFVVHTFFATAYVTRTVLCLSHTLTQVNAGLSCRIILQRCEFSFILLAPLAAATLGDKHGQHDSLF